MYYSIMCLNFLALLVKQGEPVWTCGRVFVCVCHLVIELVHNTGQSHHSFSDGQSCNIQYANCLLLNMLHQSGLIMTLF